MIDISDMLYLLSVHRVPGNLPLVTSFTYQDCSVFRLRVVVIQTYITGRLNYLSEPKTLGGTPILQTMTIYFASLDMYQYRVMFFREECSRGRWRIDRMLLTALSPVMTLTALEIVPGKGMFCEGLLIHGITWMV